MANIDLATYVAKFEADTSGIDKGFGEADSNLKSKLGGMEDWSKLAIGGAIVGIVAGVGKVITEGVKATADLDENMSKFQASTGATGEEVEKVRAHAKELYKVNTDSMEDIIDTSDAMKKTMGLTVTEIERTQQSFMDYAKTTGRDNAEVVESIGKVGKAWDLSADEMVGATDMFKASSEKFGTDIGAVEKAMKDIAPASKALGLGFEETNGMMNLMADSGLDVEQSVKAMNYAAKQVESPEQFRTMMEDIQAIEDPTERTQKAVELFGSRAGVSMASVLDGTVSLDDFMLSMEETEGTVSDASDAFDGNFNVQLELAKKMFSGLAIEIGEKFMPIINSVLSWVMDNLPAIMETVGRVIDKIGDGITFVIDIIKNMINAFKENKDTVDTTWNAIQEVISGVVDAIMSIVNGFIDLFKLYWEQYGEYILEYIRIVWDTITGVFQGAVDMIKGVIDLFISIFKGDWEGMGQALSDITSGLWDIIQTLFQGAIDFIANVMDVAITTLKKIATSIMTAIWQAFKDIWDKVKEWTKTSWESLGTLIDSFKDKFKEIAKTVFTFLWNGLKEIWATISKWVSTSFENLKDAIGDFKGKFKESAKTVFNALWDGLKEIWSSVTKWVSTSFNNLKDAIIGFASKFKSAGKDIFNKLWDGLKEIFSRVVTWVSNKIGSLPKTITDEGSKFVNAGKDMFNSVWDGMKSIWTNLSKWVSDKVSWLSDKLMFWKKSNNEMDSGGGGGGTRSTPNNTRSSNMPQYKVGTPFVPNDQLAFLHKGEAIIPAKYNPFNNNKTTNPVTKDTTQNFNIAKLEFPNVRDAKDIEKAIQSLSSYATQWAKKK